MQTNSLTWHSTRYVQSQTCNNRPPFAKAVVQCLVEVKRTTHLSSRRSRSREANTTLSLSHICRSRTANTSTKLNFSPHSFTSQAEMSKSNTSLNLPLEHTMTDQSTESRILNWTSSNLGAGSEERQIGQVFNLHSTMSSKSPTPANEMRLYLCATL
jgi:hypothetical protein